ncbi:MAG: CAP domain-containing protein [Oscillospiraceae bacterium]|nr:CAP domain-containing protein [Oscillospiraceae bacterium]
MKKILKLTIITGIIISILSFGSLTASASCPLTNMLFGGNSFGNLSNLFGGNNSLASLFGGNNSCGNNNYNSLFSGNNSSGCPVSDLFGNFGNNTSCQTGNCTNNNTCNTCPTGNCANNSTCPAGNCVTGTNQLTNCTECNDCSQCPECPQCEENQPEIKNAYDLKKGYTYSLKVTANGARSLTVNSSDPNIVTAKLRGAYINGTAIVYLQAKNAGTATVTVCSDYNVCETVYITVDGGGQTSSEQQQISACDSFAEDVLKYVNEARIKNGLSALKLDSDLCGAAKVRAKEVAVKFSHTRPDGTSCFTVLNEFGIKFNICGENIALGYNDAKTVVNAWMNSSSHRANILNANYKYMGLGKVNTGWGQLFIG